ncbi:MAG: hypothetical protein EOM55_02455 [Clostridia bacterium]|nr:hypothetical protein [Clostridia bacterium]
MKIEGDKKSKLIFYMLVAIIALFLAGIIYQFVCIKQLESRVSELETTATINYEIESISLANLCINI